MSRGALDRLKAIQDGQELTPAVYATLGISVAAAEPGKVAMELHPARTQANPQGMVAGGVIATVLDTAMAWACDTLCPEGSNCVTIDFTVNFIRPVGVDDETLTAVAETVHAGGRVMVAEGKLSRPDGKLIAIATTTCMVTPTG